MSVAGKDAGGPHETRGAARGRARTRAHVDDRIQQLHRAARAALRRSTALQTRVPRGAALLTTDGRIYDGAETEPDPQGGLTGCAERAAIAKAILDGQRSFGAIWIRTPPDHSAESCPCGSCLQVMCEFSPTMQVWWGKPRSASAATARELLPGAFGRAHLDDPANAAGDHRAGVAGDDRANATGNRRKKAAAAGSPARHGR